jgi:thiamine-phosphate pyrophosphorylase
MGGVTAVQLRDKETPTGTLLPLARRLRDLCHAHRAVFFVNDRVDLALAAGADGVHVGDDDLPVDVVRSLAPHLWVGASADLPSTARAAVEAGAHYLGCGTVWATESKGDAGIPIGVDGLRAVAEAVSVPVVAIGGITLERAHELEGSGAAGLALIRGLWDAPDLAGTARRFLTARIFTT